MKPRMQLLRLLFGASVLFLLSVPAHSLLITNYTVTSVTSAELPGLAADHWAQYTSLCDSARVTKRVSLTNALKTNFVRLSYSDTRYPFFAYNSTPFYVNSVGFLSPTWYGMCQGYCERDFFATVMGNYAFSDNPSTVFGGGGDWPMIAFYLAPFEVSNVDPTRNYIVTRSDRDPPGTSPTTAPGTDSYTTVEYCNVPLQGTAATSQGLTAQVVVYANGTIVMRYQTLPPEDVLPQYVRSTGLVYSRRLRTVVPTPTRANGVVAYRFDPVYDTCDAATDAAACAAAGAAGSAGAGRSADCVWCGATSACATRSMVADVCPGGQWAMAAGDSGAGAQKFYNVSVDLRPRALTDLTGLDSTTYQIRTSSVYFRRRTVLFRTARNLYPTCMPGFTCATQTTGFDCNPAQNTCVDGSYYFGLLVLESKFSFASSARYTDALLGMRVDGETLCDLPGGCMMGLVAQLSGILYDNGYDVMPTFSVQLYVDGNDMIDMILRCNECPDGAPFLAYPPIRIGLVRHGVSDASSVLVPQSLQRSGVHVRFVPQTACADCGLHGSCDEATGVCGCMAGYYGAQCRACPVCGEGSVCDDGVGGSGACVCAGGGDCGSGCDAAGGDVGGGCVGCSAVGGRCECGRCVCVDGWSGANCSEAPVDGCRAYSFDGCEVCGQHEGCVFCFDSTCYNASLSGTRSGYRCSYSTPAADTRACRTYGSYGLHFPAAKLSTVAPIGALAVAIVVLLVLAVSCWWNARVSPRVPNPAMSWAMSGRPTFSNPLTQRAVAKGAFLRRRIAEVPVMAVPLKQVSLKKMFQRRVKDHEKDRLTES